MLEKIVRVIFPSHRYREEPAELELQKYKQLIRAIAISHPDEIACDECFEQLDIFAEVTLAGKNVTEAMPLVQDHLDHCRDCREEFEALLVALSAIS